MGEVILKLNKITKTYRSGTNHTIKAVNNLNLEVHKGEFLIVMGSSGSGKSTLLNIIGALDKPDDGTIHLNGKWMNEIFDEPQATEYRSENIGFIFQSFNLLNDLSVEDNISLPLVLRGMHKKTIDEMVNKALAFVDLAHWKNHMPAELSGGQQQRVAIARAIVAMPKILLADEPTGNLDFERSKEILGKMLEIKEKLNQTIIMVTHDVHVAAYADRIIFLRDGSPHAEYRRVDGRGNVDEIIELFKKVSNGEV